MTYLLRLVACLLIISAAFFSVMSWAVIPEQKVLSSDGAERDRFGLSASIDGDTAIIGAMGDPYSGSAYVYVRSNGVWSEQAKLTASDAAQYDYFGSSVSIDGDTAVIGARYDDGNGNGNDSGSAYVYVRSNGVWSEQQKLTASDGAQEDYFGRSVSIDGDTAVISGVTGQGLGSGTAYVYVRSNGVWSEQQKLTASDGVAYDGFGFEVSISGDTAVIGAPREMTNESGSAYVYVRSNGVWSEQAKLTASDAAQYDYFGSSVSIDGDTAVIGARYDDGNGNGNDSGSAYVYVRSNGVWSEQQKLTASDTAEYDRFGNRVSINGDIAAIGTYANCDCDFPRPTYVYVRSNGVWSEQAILNDGGEYDDFGSSVSIDDNTVLIGAPNAHPEVMSSAIFYDLTSLMNYPAVITGDTSATINFGTSTTGTLIATDSDGLTDGTYFSLATSPLHGTAGINIASGFWFYFAAPAFIGADPFTVTVTDDEGHIAEQIISITTINPDDVDNDGVNNDVDAFPSDPAEWSDVDADMVGDNADSCPTTSNVNQSNIDGDAFGDACDSDIDGDGTDNAFDAFPNDATESADNDADNIGDNSDNCMNDANADQANLDGDALGDTCDPDMDGDGIANYTEIRFGGDETDNTDAAVSLANVETFSETAPADSDLDGVPDDVEALLGEDNTSSTFQDLLDTLSTIATAKNVPAMGGIGLLALGLSMLGLGAVRLRRK